MSMILLKTIALTNKEGGYDILKKATPQLTRKKSYSRLSKLTSASVIITQNGRYFLTSFGEVVHNAQMMIEKTLDRYWNLNAIFQLDFIVIMNLLEIDYDRDIQGCHYYRCR
ncbi:MAG: hypothetical protein DLM72_01685 [Candidatus Nitrosopolaris wilkensis]|nr:MAG: hypothetical protein DLM72_01685 [Candidatus Nitrosopolaris wilkensis]